MKQIILLTACINPNGMSFTALSDPSERLSQYKNALDWYIANTSLPIVFVENTGYDLTPEYLEYISNERIEILTFQGNYYDRSFGKGYGEAKIIDYALSNSKILNKTNEILIIKITGRLICTNINNVIVKYNRDNTVYSQIGKDDWGGNICTSEVFVAPANFFYNFFLPNKEMLDDSKHYHFEHLLYDSIEHWKIAGNRFREFIFSPQLSGIRGTTGEEIKSNMSTKEKFASIYLYIMHRFFNYRGYLNPFYKGKAHK